MSVENTHKQVANNLRILSAAMVEKAKSGHPGGAMGGADFINTLYTQFLIFDPKNPKWAHRDRFFLDPGHMSPMLYSTLALVGYFTTEDLKEFRQWGSATPGHPEVDFMRGIENTSGPLGQGHTMAIGAAIAERFLCARFGEWMSHHIYTFISDGGIQEEISQGAGRIAGHLGLSNLIMFYDSNDIQLSTSTKEVTNEDTARKYESWGWKVITIDGNCQQSISKALTEAHNEKEKPCLIIGKTIMGLGCVKSDGSNFERQCSTHGQPITNAGADFELTIKNLGGDPADPFKVFPESKALYQQRAIELEQIIEQKKELEQNWRKSNVELAKKLDQFLSNETPKVDYASIAQKVNSATRGASATVLGVLAQEVENMIVSSADLSNSDKTDGFLSKTRTLKKGDFSGAFLQAGVCELTMASLMNGIALHGGVIAACGTFFVFSDYMKPALRLSALMQLPVKYIWTHDAFRVGEDGPTHQPIEHEAQIRLMEKLKNHSGNNSMLVLRPADTNETTVAWEMAMNNTSCPTGLILSRQNIQDLPNSTYEIALQANKGAYIVQECDDANPDVILLASGSEVSTLIAGESLLRAKGIKCRVVSVISEGLFRNQTQNYQESILPTSVPKFGLTAGLSDALRGLVGFNGGIWSLDHFGYSAPYQVLDKEFGFTGENVCEQVMKLLATR